MDQKRPRWKLLIIMLAVPTVVWLVMKQIPRVVETGASGAIDLLFVILVIVLGLLWLVGFSRLRWAIRLLGVSCVVLLALVLRMDGHTGGFFPQFSFVWSKQAATVMPELDGNVADKAATVETDGAENFPRFLGADMNNEVSGELLTDDWFENPPKELWRKQIGEGWSSFAVADGLAFTMEQRGEEEVTVCYELATGNAVWVHAEPVRFEESMGGDGPRSTPTISDGKLFTMGATGILNCHDARTGMLVWGRDVLAEAGHEVPAWAKSCSPLIVEGKVIVTLGRKKERNLAAFDLETGTLVWRSGDYSASYASPVVATLAGRRQIVAIQAKSVNGYDIETGDILWSFPIGNPQGNCATPMIVGDNRVLTSSGYGYGSHLIEISESDEGFKAAELWYSRKLKAKFADLVVHDEHVYGLDEGRLVCVNLEDGERAWRGTKFGHGQILGVGDGHLIVQEEAGGVSVVEANSEDEVIVGKFDALSKRTWNHPVLAGRILLVRNDREAIAFEYPAKK